MRFITHPQRPSEWRRWFAWYPVRIEDAGADNRYAWLEVVERSYELVELFECAEAIAMWHYRARLASGEVA